MNWDAVGAVGEILGDVRPNANDMVFLDRGLYNHPTPANYTSITDPRSGTMATPATEVTGTLSDLTPEENKAVFRRYIDELWNAGKIEVIDEILHDDVFYHEPSFQGATRKADMSGIIESFHKAFPAGAFTFKIEELIAEDDLVFTWLSFVGEQKDEFCGVPSSGKTLKFNVLGYYRFAEGKIIECRKHNVGENHDFISAMGIREQLGA